MNELSSRSHLIMTLTLNQIDERDMSVTSSKLNMVDLAGSERVKDSLVSGQQLKEACHINKSLFALSGVVNSLQAKGPKKNVSYRDSNLTKLLSDSLGGNCKTTLIVMLSPSLAHCNETNNTLRFAHSCKQILNVVKPNKYKGTIPASTPFKLRSKKQKSSVKTGLPWLETSYSTQPILLKSKTFGDIFVLKVGEDSWSKQMVCLHGCPSDHSAFEYQFQALAYMQFQVFAIDIPGYGRSNGPKLPSRSDQVLKPQGAADLVLFVMKELKLKKPVVNGYDWGGAIALKMAIANRSTFSKVIAYHPSFNEAEKDELKKVKQPTLIQWIKQD
mmetsp:Transcript_1114/g.2044  ORF Transcript_1114/g.2044 Transcript_1114/m.2044 type:complete len:330 (-) Transcript_1114:1408-2397(-)